MRGFAECDCVCVCIHAANGKKWELFVDHKFKPGITVAFKLKPKFKSPDESKFVSSEGKWSREQTYEIPEEGVVFSLEMNGNSIKLALDDDDQALTNFSQFTRKFLGAFNAKLKPNESLMLATSEGLLTESSNLSKYASESFTVRGWTKADTPPVQEVPAADIPPAAYSVSPRSEPGGGAGGGDASQKKGQISTIVVFAGQKKRVVLKFNPKKNVNEYRMDVLREKLTKKFKAKGLNGHFDLQTSDGQRIQHDQDIRQYLEGYKGEIQVTQ